MPPQILFFIVLILYLRFILYSALPYNFFLMQPLNVKKTVVIGLSGGVDSSVSALLLKEQGYRVLALFMKNWEEEDANGQCHATSDYEDALAVCDHLDIPLYTVNFAKEYQEHVFEHFLDELKKGLTPNPDILCNKEIKFKAFYQKALQLGGDYVATGHYCQTILDNGAPLLMKGQDPLKDQSYFLHAIDGITLKRVLFPIGGITKSQVRKIAQDHKIPTAKKRDSTGICFIGKRNFNQFVSSYLGYHPGNIETTDGKIIGQHRGSAYHTVGQRKGLDIGGPGAAWFVVGKDVERNVIIVAQGDNHPALFAQTLIGKDPTWILGSPPKTFPLTCSAKIRYRSPDQPCTVTKETDGTLTVHFETPQRAITPGQSVVFYDGTICLGGAVITKAIS